MDFSKTEKRTHDYVRRGTTNLFAALNTNTGEVIGRKYSEVVWWAGCGSGVRHDGRDA
jgi:hypothetical protein